MKNSAIIIFLFSLFLMQCDNSTDPSLDLDFTEMEIHYSKMGGWINNSILNIYGEGVANAYEISQGNDTLKSSSKILSKSEQNEIAKLFDSFSTYNSYYHPEHYKTDQDHHRIIFIYSGKPDTVSIYMPSEPDLPNGLRKILNDLGNIWDELIE